jgi:hypothetical protein
MSPCIKQTRFVFKGFKQPTGTGVRRVELGYYVMKWLNILCRLNECLYNGGV